MSIQNIINAGAAMAALTAKITGFVGQADAKIAAKEAQVDQFLHDASPESRFEQSITIGGDTDHLYPVWWRFPDNRSGLNRLSISRSYAENPGVINAESGAQAGLLLVLEGSGYPHHGDANYMRVKKYSSTYRVTASHLQFGMFATPRHRQGYDVADPLDFPAVDTSYLYSGLYLRGGGLTYHFAANWDVDLRRLPDENDPNSEANVFSALNTENVVSRLPYLNPDQTPAYIQPIED